MNIINKMYWCKHEHIVVSHYLEDNLQQKSCRIRCRKCDSYIYSGKDGEIEKAYDFIDRHKERFKSLYDCTCDDLNNKFDIKDGFEYDIL